MFDARFAKAEALFLGALDVPEEQRFVWLQAQCAGDDALFAKVARLLAADAEQDGFLEPMLADEIARIAAPGDATRDRGRRIGPFVLEEPLGEGGMGVVWRARRDDGQFEQTVALKLVRRAARDRASLASFVRERQILARLEHAGIARLVDGGAADDGTPWLAMEKVDGEPIDTFCDRRRMSLDARVALFERVCDAVHHAHKNLLVHRDLKPSNVLVTEAGEPKLLDFGIARRLDVDLASTAPHDRALTPRYASPEQIRGEPVGIASDVYSLGVVLHELLVGRLPYAVDDTTSRYALERAICEIDAKAPSVAAIDAATAAARGATPAQLVHALRGDLDAIVGKALAKDPERRYASVAALADDLRAWRTRMPVSARPVGIGGRLAKFARRNPLAAGGIALAVFALVLALILEMRAAARDRTRLDAILRLSDMQRAADLEREAIDAWPPRPERAAAYAAWLQRARELIGRRALHEQSAAMLRVAGFDEVSDRWLDDAQQRLLVALDGLESDDPHGATIASVARRLEATTSIAHATLDERRAAWDEAIAAVTKAPAYGGLALKPQWGLSPLGVDPRSGLWEFGVFASGDLPQRDANGALELTPRSCAVLVLVPGGTTTLGAQAADAAAPLFDPDAQETDAPVHTVTMAPFFIGKHELTQEQWYRLTDQWPSAYGRGSTFGAQTTTPMNPVEQITWPVATQMLRHWDLRLPTESEWEHAARAGTHTPWWTGREAGSLAGAANLADRFARENGGNDTWQYQDAFDDGATVHAPVGSYRANAFGLHDVLGNVWEWCADTFADQGSKDRVTRGGGFFNPPTALRVSHRYFVPQGFTSHSLGVRAARSVE